MRSYPKNDTETPLTVDTDYFWRVDPYDAIKSVVGDEWSFSTAADICTSTKKSKPCGCMIPAGEPLTRENGVGYFLPVLLFFTGVKYCVGLRSSILGALVKPKIWHQTFLVFLLAQTESNFLNMQAKQARLIRTL